MTSSIYILLALQLILNQSFNCSSTGSRRKVKPGGGSDDVRASNVAAVKSVLLTVLGLESEPDRSALAGNSRQLVPDFMWELYRQQLTENSRHQRQSTEAIVGSHAADHSRTRHQDSAHSYLYGGNTIRSFTATMEDSVSPPDGIDQLVANSTPVLPVPADGESPPDGTVRVSFNVSQSLVDDVVYGAELRLCRHSTLSRQRRDADHDEPGLLQLPKRYRISVYQVMKSSSDIDPIRRLLDTKIISAKSSSSSSSSAASDSSAEHWVSLDVSPAVATWKQLGHRSNLGLDVETSTLDGKPIDVERHIRVRRSTTGGRGSPGRGDRGRGSGPGRVASSSRSTESEDLRRQPVLVTYADDRRSVQSTSKRKRSAAAGARAKDRKTSSNRPPSCRRRPLYVDFAEVEWNDWIVAPVGYQAFVCSGACPVILPDHLNATNHAQIQSLLHSVNRHVPAPCCVPTELSPISLLYFDETGTVVLRNYQDMVVDACGCR